MTKTYSKPLAEAINQFLTEDDWKFSFNEDEGIFSFKLNLENMLKHVEYYVRVRKEDYIVHVIAPINADHTDQQVIAQMAEFICRANFGIVNGNFELDLTDGEIRYKCFVNCDGCSPSSEVIKDSIYVPASMYDRYASGLIGVLFGQLTAQEAIAKCEN